MTEQEINNLIDSKIAKTKMSQLPEATQTSGLYSIGYNGNQSVKYKANLLQGDPLTVRKTYQTEAEALADKNPIDATTSLPLTVGQFVSIVDDGEKNGIYRIGSIDGSGTMSLELQGKLGDLSDYAKKGGSTKTLKEVDDEVDGLKKDLYDNEVSLVLTFENGNISIDTGANTTANLTQRLRSIGLTPAKHLVASCATGSAFRVYIYDSTGNYVTASEPVTHWDGRINGFFRILEYFLPSAPISPGQSSMSIITYGGYKFVEKSEIQDLAQSTDIKIAAVWDNLYTDTAVVPVFENGNMSTTTGRETAAFAEKRLRTVEFIEAESLSVEVGATQEARIYLFDESKVFIGLTDYADSFDAFPIHGFCRILLRNKNDSEILPADAQITISARSSKYLLKENYDPNGGGDTLSYVKHKEPRFTAMPFGDQFNTSYPDKMALFETVFAAYPAEVEKVSIGFDSLGQNEIYAYWLTPEVYTVTIAVTAHVHADERYNPVGLLGLLDEISKVDPKDEFCIWLKNNVRWVIVPIASPLSYIANERTTLGTNFNRNMDYRFNSLTDEDKGEAPYSLTEASNLRAFFIPLAEQIDFHLDLHDVPRRTDSSYAPFHSESFIWMQDVIDLTSRLAVENDTIPIRHPYIAGGGSVMQFFNEVLGVPSVTPEHCTRWWSDVYKVSPAAQVAKAAEQIAANLVMFANRHTDLSGAAYYKKLCARAFGSEQFGISTWSWAKFYTETANTPGWIQATTSGVQTYRRTPVGSTKTIMIIAGVAPDNKKSSLLSKWMMELISNPKHMYIERLAMEDIIFIPVLNPEGGAESTLTDRVSTLMSELNPDYILQIKGTENSSNVLPILLSSNLEENFTSYTVKGSNAISIFPSSGIEAVFGRRYTTLHLNNPIVRTERFGFGVQMWLEAAINDIAAFAKE